MSREEWLEQGAYIPDKIDENVIVYLKLGFRVAIKCIDYFPYQNSPKKRLVYFIKLDEKESENLASMTFSNVSLFTQRDLDEGYDVPDCTYYVTFYELNQLLCRLKNYLN